MYAGGPTPSTVSTTSRLAQLDAAPQMAEQMAQRGSITSRVPQKYLIQNQSGLTVFYWVDPVGAWLPMHVPWFIDVRDLCPSLLLY